MFPGELVNSNEFRAATSPLRRTAALSSPILSAGLTVKWAGWCPVAYNLGDMVRALNKSFYLTRN